MSRPVYIAGSGLLCARGDSPEAVAASLWAGGYQAEKRRLGEREFPFFSLPLPETDWMKRAEQAVRHVTTQLGPLAADTPLFIASSSFQIGHFEQQGEPFSLPVANAEFSQQIARWMQLDGSCSSFSSACISGFSAIEAARSLIASGQIDEAVIIGFELANNVTLAGFAAMELLSRTSCRPFDLNRDGLVLGEAVAAVRLSATPANWRIAGLRTGIDAYSSTGPDPEGGPIASVTVNCLNEADFLPGDIELIKVQAAGSPGTDLAEANALKKVFGDQIPPLLSLKPALGHTLGASGIAELATLIACLASDQIPATDGYSEADPEIEPVSPVDRNQCHIKRAMLNLIGFGGGLATMIIERA
jgi:3-oxoacyl-[acyl-carrier-protein] synthase-1